MPPPFSRHPLPHPKPPEDSSPAAQLRREIEQALEREFGKRGAPGAREVQAVLDAVMSRYNNAPQPDLGGLSPHDVQRLIDADWESAWSAITLDASVTLADLAGATTLHDVRLLMSILADPTWGPSGVKATPNGNLPRPVVAAFRERAGAHAAEREAYIAIHPVRNEQNHWWLYRTRVLLEVAGLVRRRSGRFRLTKRGESLRDDAKAGELFVLLARTLFRRVDLAHFDGAEHIPEFQRTIGYTLARFAQVGDEWSAPSALLPAIVIPSVRDALPPREGYDALAHILEMRFLSVLAGLGLAERRESAYARGAYLRESAFRKTGVFGRVVRVGV